MALTTAFRRLVIVSRRLHQLHKGDGDSRLVEGAVIVFEVLSPGNSATDRIIKVREYLRVTPIHTYLIVEQSVVGVTVLRRRDDAWTNSHR